MKYRLALDLGTTSLGWAVFRLDDALRPNAIVRAGVRIFSDGRHPKDGSSLAVQRREARAMRRRRDRLLKRKARMMRKLVEYGFFPEDKAARKALERQYPNPYELRERGLDEALEPGAFARALFHINQRRGFKSNRRTDKADNDSSALKSAIAGLRTQLRSLNARTVGELLSLRLKAQQQASGRKQGVRARYREEPVQTSDGKRRINKSYDLYIDRQMVADEFDQLWARQKSFNPALFHEQARTDLRDTLLYQRNLRPVRPGRCTLIPDENRAPLALPSSQRFRIYQEVNNLRLQDAFLNESALSLQQRDRIAEALEKQGKLSFNKIRSLLVLSEDVQFNLEDVKRTELKGNATSAILAKKTLFGEQWHQFDPDRQEEIVTKLLNEENENELIEWLIQETGISEAQAIAIANTTLPDGYGSLSQEALRRLVPVLKTSVCTYSEAVQRAGFAHHSQLEFFHEEGEVDDWIDPQTGEVKKVFKQLPYYAKALQRHVAFGSGKPDDPDEKRYGKIANPTVHIGLNQLRVVVNALIKRYGRPTEVVVELARDLKESQKQREETQRQQAQNQKRNDRINEEIAGIRRCRPDEVKGWEREKWILWEELSKNVCDRRCPYTGEQISARKLLSEEIEIEHILPFSLTLDDSLNNKTVSLVKANRIKGNRTPWEAREDFEKNGWAYSGILERAKQMPSKSKVSRFAENGYEKWLGEEKSFLARALNDTRHLSRVAKAYLELVCPGSGVRVIPGRMTAILRRHLGLNELLSDNGIKNRDDHRHHAVDACVIGITDQGLLQQFAQANQRAKAEGLNRLAKDFKPPWPTYRTHVIRAVENIWVSHRPDHGYQGGFMEDTAYGIARDGTVKQRRSKEKGQEKKGREIKNVIPILEPGQADRHGLDADGKPLPYKGYQGGSNYCLEIFLNEKGKWEGEVISRFHAYQIVRNEGEERLRHPNLAQNGKPLVMRLMRNDVVVMETEAAQGHEGDGDEAKKKDVYRVVKIASVGTLTLAPLHEANVDARYRDRTFFYTYKTSGSLRDSKGRRAAISPVGELRDPGFLG